MEIFSWDPVYTGPLAATCCMTAGFLIYLLIYQSQRLESYLLRRYGPEKGQTLVVVTGKMAGLVLLGLLPALVALSLPGGDLGDYGLGPVTTPAGWYWMAGGSVVVIAMNFLAGRKPAHYAVYPLIRRATWRPPLLLLSLVGSTLFLVAYEFMFRGFFLFACVSLMGPWVAIAVNVLVYALAHIHKGPVETIGAVPFGVLLCWITLSTGSIWPVIVIHIALSLSSDLFALYFNPEMRVEIR